MSEALQIDEKEISLFRLKSELVELMRLREDDTLQPDERKAVEGQIKAYIGAELRKVDNIAAFIRHRRAMAQNARDEAARCAKLAAHYENEEEFVLGMCKDLMESFGEKKLEGVLGAIALHKNGGAQALETNDLMLPDEFVDVTITINRAIWKALIHWPDLRKDIAAALTKCIEDRKLHMEPNNTAIREALKSGPVSGAKLAERGTHVRLR